MRHSLAGILALYVQNDALIGGSLALKCDPNAGVKTQDFQGVMVFENYIIKATQNQCVVKRGSKVF